MGWLWGILVMCLLVRAQTPLALEVAQTSPTHEPTTTVDLATLSEAGFRQLLENDPIAALEVSIASYESTVRTLRGIFQKQERIRGKLNPVEVIRFNLREEPFAVAMHWEQGAGSAAATIFARGENDGAMLVWIRKLFVQSINPRGAIPRNSARYSIEEFGLKQSTERTWKAWREQQKHGQLIVEYLGERTPAETGQRRCFVIKRTCVQPEIDAYIAGEDHAVTAKNEADAFSSVTAYFDCETRLQVGTELHRKDGELAGAYWFRELEVNPSFDADTFTRAAFKR
jgi:hypothetical protein